MFNLVQPVFNPNRTARAAYGQVLSNMARNGHFGGPLRPAGTIFDGSKGVQLVPLFVRYNAMFNLVQQVFNANRAAGTAYSQIFPHMARNGRFGGPL